MRFAVEPFESWYREGEPLFRAHWELVGRHKDLIELNPDYERWIKLDRGGLVMAVTARMGWKLAGYAMYLISPSLNYRDHVLAYCHAIYIEPRYLKGLAAVRFLHFIRFCDAELKKRGATKTVMHRKMTHDFGRLLAKLGYEDCEILADRVL